MKDDYPVKMNYGCFIPLLVFAIIGIIAVFSPYLKWLLTRKNLIEMIKDLVELHIKLK